MSKIKLREMQYLWDYMCEQSASLICQHGTLAHYVGLLSGESLRFVSAPYTSEARRGQVQAALKVLADAKQIKAFASASRIGYGIDDGVLIETLLVFLAFRRGRTVYYIESLRPIQRDSTQAVVGLDAALTPIEARPVVDAERNVWPFDVIPAIPPDAAHVARAQDILAAMRESGAVRLGDGSDPVSVVVH